MKKYTLYIVTALFFAFCVASASMAKEGAEQTQFFTAIQDLPLMPGLEELPEQTVIFDKPEGRIVETIASIDGLSKEQVKTYYQLALPAFGWAQTSEMSYKRGTEHLNLIFEDIEGHIFLKVMVNPN